MALVYDVPQVEVPVGIRAPQWVTVQPDRTVLVVVHNVTTVTRLLDILPAFDSDPRVQVVVSCSDTDPFQHGLRQLIDSLGLVQIPWEQARLTRFDLAIAASHHGGLPGITAPLVILSHGIGYTKYSPGNRKPETGNRQTFGLSPQWVLYDGAPFADALVLSHEEQLDRLTAAAPQAADVAVLAGDPCYDRLLASIDRRAEYRNALGSGDRRVILLSSTWWTNSLLGSWPDLVRTLLAELPADEFQVLAAIHPNVWHGHGPWQVRSWLGDCLRSGLTLLSEVDGWRPGLIAADLVIGDHGSVTGYAAACGRPVLLAAFADDDIAPGSPIALLGRTAPRLSRAEPLAEQVESAIDEFVPGQYDGVATLVTSAPGESLNRLRELFYRLMSLPEPTVEAPLTGLPSESLVDTTPVTSIAARVEYSVNVDAREVRLTRYPAELPSRIPSKPETTDVHIVCPADYPLRTIRSRAAVLTGGMDQPIAWLAQALERNPFGSMAALVGHDNAIVRSRDGLVIEGHGAGVQLPSAVYAWSTTGQDIPERLSINGKPVQLTIRS